jgi:MFS family permease
MSSLKNGYIGVAIAALITVLFATSALFGAPVWLTVIASALFASAVTYLSALVYGVFNDLFATKASLPYFLLGHQPQQQSLLRTNDPVAQGVAWGIAATYGPALLASIAFGIGTVITASFVPMASFIFPVMFIAMPLIAFGADIYAKRKAKQYVKEGHEYYGNLDYARLGANYYQINGLTQMAPNKEDKAAWLANSDRNMFGFTKLPLIGVGVLASAITLSAVHSFLPAFLFSTLLATTVPVAFVAAAIVFLVAAGAYMYINRNKQIDNKFKLAFEAQQNLEHELYLDDDLDLVEQLSEGFKSKIPDLVVSGEPSHYPNPLQSVKPLVMNSASQLTEDQVSLTLF